jgi:general secretion pathway protein J
VKGFTLVEMLVALFIVALVGVGGVAALRFTADNRDIVKAHTEQTAQVQRARALLKADLSQAVSRRTRDQNGVLSSFTFVGGQPTAAGPFLALVRSGRVNADAAMRSSLQYVEYGLADGKLVRRVRAAPDGAALGPPQVLIEGVSRASAAYLTQNAWRPDFRGTGALLLPQAARLELEITGLGQVRQDFLVTGEAS